jgi:glycosyltransferase involved in cell wall biosynthesis
MKILCISNYYPPFFEGGYEISVAETMSYLSTREHRIFVLCGNRGAEDQRADILSFSQDPIQRKLRYINYREASFWNKHMVEKHNHRLTLKACALLKPDLVYFGNQKAISISPTLAVQKLKLPRVFDIGDDWLKTYLGNGFTARLFRMLKRLIPFTIGGDVKLDPVIVPSRWMADELKAKYHCSVLHIIPRGIALPKPNARKLSHPLRFIFAGRIEPNKGLDLVIEAANLLKTDHGDFSVDIYGAEDPAYTDAMRDLIARYSLVEHFNFMGHSHDLPSVLPNYDVFLMPTMARETFGRVIIEAMAAGLIVIATNAYGPAEIVDHQTDSLLFQRGSAPALADAIRSLMESDLEVLEQMRVQARHKVKAHYELSLVKKRVENILESMNHKP